MFPDSVVFLLLNFMWKNWGKKYVIHGLSLALGPILGFVTFGLRDLGQASIFLSMKGNY